jgi:hypothetical protein
VQEGEQPRPHSLKFIQNTITQFVKRYPIPCYPQRGHSGWKVRGGPALIWVQGSGFGAYDLGLRV